MNGRPDVPQLYLSRVDLATTTYRLMMATLYHDRAADRETAHLTRYHIYAELGSALAAWVGLAADYEFGPAYGTPDVRVSMLGALARLYEAATANVDDLFKAWHRGSWPNRAEGAPQPLADQAVPE